MGFFDKLKTGLNKTKESFNTKINNVFSNFRKVDEDFLEELEEVLIMSDMGVDTSVKIVNNLRKRIKKDNIKDEEEVKRALREEIKAIFDEVENKLNLDTKPSVIQVAPDVIDLSSAVEKTSEDGTFHGKDPEKIRTIVTMVHD